MGHTGHHWRMLTEAAVRSRAFGSGVFSRRELAARGCARSQMAAALSAGRWQAVGLAIVTHAGPLTRPQMCRAAVISTGPRASLASFTAAEAHGLHGWLRPEIHVITPPGVARPIVPWVPVVRHVSTRAEGRDIQPLVSA